MTNTETLEHLEQFLKTASADKVLDFITQLAQQRPDIHALLLKKLQDAKP